MFPRAGKRIPWSGDCHLGFGPSTLMRVRSFTGPAKPKIQPSRHSQPVRAMEIATVGVSKDEFVWGLAADPQVASMNILVTSGTQSDEVATNGFALTTVQNHMVDFQPDEVIRASGGGAAIPVATQHLTPLRGGGQASFFIEAQATISPVVGQ